MKHQGGARYLLLLLLCSAPLGWAADVGVLLRPVGDETNAWLAEHVLGAAAREERLGADDLFHQHQAVRHLRASGCCGAMLLSSGCPQQQAPPLVLCPALLRPDTTRAALDLIRDLGWRDLLYISHDPQQGLERLQMMFRVGYGALRLRVQGLTAQGLRSGGRRRVLLDLPPPLAADLLRRRAHVTPADDNHYLLMQPTLPDFWLLPELQVLKVFGFTFNSESPHQMPLPPHPNLTVENYYFHDAALFAWKAMEQRSLKSITDILQKVVVSEGGLSGGGVRFSAQGTRADVNLTVMHTTTDGVQKYGWWSDAGKVGGLRRSYPPPRQGALSQVQEKRILRITSRLRSPFLVRNATGGLEGFCADLALALCDELDARCELGLAADGLPGDFDGSTWSGMVGDIVTGRADLAVGDLAVTGVRQRAVDFLEPFLEGHLSLLMARPSPSSSPSLAPSAWGCAFIAAALVAVALLVLGGPPDTIEAASALWRNKLSPSTAAWLVLGSATFQPTGVYPRSLASRVLVVSWWLFTGFFACMLLASLAAQLRLRASADNSPQMAQLQALSLQAILKEAVENGWPEIGVLSSSYTEKSIQASGVPLLREVARVARRVSSLEEGEALVVGGGGGFALLTESAYIAPCHAVAVQSTSPHASFAPALSLRLQPQLRANVSAAYERLSSSGRLGHLHRKWWGNQCDHEDTVSGGQATSAWRPLALLFGALVVLVLVFAAQYALKVRSKHSRRQQLTFEDIHFEQRLPTPPPELLPPPPPTHEVPEIQQGSVNGAESFQDFFERMRTGSS